MIIHIGERKFQETKVAKSISATYGTFTPGSESMWKQKFHNSSPSPLADTVKLVIIALGVFCTLDNKNPGV